MNIKTIRILVIENDSGYADYLMSILAKADGDRLSVAWCVGLQAGLERLHEPGFDILFLDTSLPDAEGRDPLAEVLSKAPHTPIVLLTTPENEAAAVDAVRSRGASDYLVKDRTGGSSLVRLVHNVIECHKLGTELRQNREELQASKARFYGMIQKCSDPIFIVDEQKVVHFANQAASDLFDREVKSFVGKPFEFPFVTDEPTQVEINCAGGGTALIQLRVEELEWGTKKAHLVWVKDLSEHNRVEETTRKLKVEHLAHEQLKELNHKKDDFLSAVTHELRNPMTPLKSVLEMFLDGSLGEITPRQRGYVEMMARNIERLTVFTTEVLTISKLESGKYRLHPQHMSVLSAVRPVVDLFKEQASQKNIAISVDVHTELFAFADPNAVAHVASNLVNNAIKYCPANTRIVISSRIRSAELVEVAVADTGPGIPGEDLNRIFDRFYQVSNKDGAGHGGSGVGLALCKNLVEAMGGEMSAESKVGEGTVFRFTLPVSPEVSKDEESIP